VYADIDPLTGGRDYLLETIPPGPTAGPEAQQVMRRPVNQVDERRNPRTNATVNQLLDRHFELTELEANTLANNHDGFAESDPALATCITLWEFSWAT
jgi:integrase